MPDFERLKVWQAGHQLALEAYRIVRLLPEEERFSLGDQMRRAAVAIPANIAEGHGRTGRAEFRPFISVALGSLSELQAAVLIARDLDYLGDYDLDRFWDLASQVGKMLGALHQHLVTSRR